MTGLLCGTGGNRSRKRRIKACRKFSFFLFYTPDWLLCQYVVMYKPVSVHSVSLVNLMHSLLI